jgi:hypothetical protein
MQIKVEIDVKPEELRRFLGLPDVAGLQEDIVAFLRDKMGQASENLSPAADFVRDNLGTLKDTGSAAVQRLLSSVKVRVTEPEPPTPAPTRKARGKASAKAKTKPRRRGAKTAG